MHRVRLLFRALFRGRAVERELRDEVLLHVELETEKNIRGGMAEAEARRKALLDFGGVERFQERTREARPTRALEDFLTDLRLAFRGLGRSPGFTFVTVLTLGLGIGASTAVFSVVSGVLLKPLPYDEPGSLVYINTYFLPESGYDFPEYAVGSPEYFDYRNSNRSMEEVAAVSTESVTLTAGEGAPEVVRAGWVSPGMFTVLRTRAFLGRTLIESDGGAEPAAVTVLSYDLWQRRFGGDSTVVGRLISLGVETSEDPMPSEVVGVMPPGFSYPGDGIQLWAPLALDPSRTWRQGHWFTMIGRLARGVTFQRAEVEMKEMMNQWAETYPDHHRGHGLFMKPLLDREVAEARPALLMLMGAVGFVLLIACANVASLLLARGESRRREVAVRSALGAGRLRLVRAPLTESFLMAAVGGVVGLLLAWLGVRILLALEPGNLPRLGDVGIDARVLVFTASAALLAALVFGLVPALRESASHPADALRDSCRSVTAGAGRLSFRRGIVLAEVALSVVLVVGAGLMTRSFRNLLVEDPGFDTRNLLYATFSLPAAEYDSVQTILFYEQLREATRTLPGVTGASYMNRPPLLWHDQNGRFHIEGRPVTPTAPMCCVGSVVTVGPGLFELLGVPLVRGRLFSDSDQQPGMPPVALVDEAAADRYWPGQDPVGQRIGPGGEAIHEVVGVVGSVTYDAPGVTFPTLYIPADRAPPFALRTRYLVVRSSGAPEALVDGIRHIVRTLDPRQAVAGTFTMDDLRDRSLARPRFVLTLLGVFAGVALLLGAIGIYGVIAYGVTLRYAEIGIRRALGAETRSVSGMILMQGLALTATGLILGLGGAIAGTRVLSGFLHEVSRTDPMTYGTVCVVMALVAVLASWLPARRAGALDPMKALRID